MLCHSALPAQQAIAPSGGILQPLLYHSYTKKYIQCTQNDTIKEERKKLQKNGWTDTVFMCLCECLRHSKGTSLTSLVMGMAEGMRGLLPSSSRVRNSILFSSSQSAYEPMSRYLHQLRTLIPGPSSPCAHHQALVQDPCAPCLLHLMLQHVPSEHYALSTEH